MRKPSIHLNGTSANWLRETYARALWAVQDAKKALAECAPNGRDYYVQEATPGLGKDASCEAMDEHRARAQMLDSIERDLAKLVEHCDR